MAAADPRLDIILDGKKQVRDFCDRDELTLLSVAERTYPPLTYVEGYQTIDLANTGGAVDKIIARIPAGVPAVLEIRYDDDGLYTILPILNEMRLDYGNHLGNAGGAYHPVVDNVNILATALNVRVFSLVPAIALANEIKAKFNLHITDAIAAIPTFHAATGTDHTVTTANATDTATLLLLVNALKAAFNLHLGDAVAHSVADVANTVTTVNAVDPGNVTFELRISKTTVYQPDPDFGKFINQVRIKTDSTNPVTGITVQVFSVTAP